MAWVAIANEKTDQDEQVSIVDEKEETKLLVLLTKH